MYLIVNLKVNRSTIVVQVQVTDCSWHLANSCIINGVKLIVVSINQIVVSNNRIIEVEVYFFQLSWTVLIRC